MSEYDHLRKRHLEHLRRLSPIQSELEKYLSIEPSDSLSPATPAPVPMDEFKQALGRMKEWEAEHSRLMAEYDKFP